MQPISVGIDDGRDPEPIAHERSFGIYAASAKLVIERDSICAGEADGYTCAHFSINRLRFVLRIPAVLQHQRRSADLKPTPTHVAIRLPRIRHAKSKSVQVKRKRALHVLDD